MARAGRGDGLVQAGERQDVNHAAISLQFAVLLAPYVTASSRRELARSGRDSAARRPPPARASDSRARSAAAGPGAARKTAAPLRRKSRRARVASRKAAAAVGRLDRSAPPRPASSAAGRSAGGSRRAAGPRPPCRPSPITALNGEIMSPITYSGASCRSSARPSRRSIAPTRRSRDLLDQQRVLRDREDVRADRSGRSSGRRARARARCLRSRRRAARGRAGRAGGPTACAARRAGRLGFLARSDFGRGAAPRLLRPIVHGIGGHLAAGATSPPWGEGRGDPGRGPHMRTPLAPALSPLEGRGESDVALALSSAMRRRRGGGSRPGGR